MEFHSEQTPCPPFYPEKISCEVKIKVITGGAHFCSVFLFRFYFAIWQVIHYERPIMKRLCVISRFIDYQKMKSEK